MNKKIPLLFIHGFPLDSTMWQPQIAAFADRHIHAIDLPGFGSSAAAPAATIDAMAAFVHQQIAALGGRAIVAGLSMGGYVLLSLLRQFPAGVAAAVFLDTRADADSPEAKQNRMNAVAEIKANGPAKVYDGLLKRLVAPAADEKVKTELQKIMQRQNPKSVIAAQEAMANRRDQTDLLPQLKVPALFVVGAHDAITPPAVMRAMHAQTKNSTLAEIPNAGHMSNMENPPAVNAALEKFLTSLA